MNSLFQLWDCNCGWNKKKKQHTSESPRNENRHTQGSRRTEIENRRRVTRTAAQGFSPPLQSELIYKPGGVSSLDYQRWCWTIRQERKPAVRLSLRARSESRCSAVASTGDQLKQWSPVHPWSWRATGSAGFCFHLIISTLLRPR